MQKLLLLLPLLLMPFTANASYQCDINIRRAMTQDLLNDPGVIGRSKTTQINAAPELSECVNKARSLLRELCKERYGGNFAGAYVSYSETSLTEYTTDAVIKGYCKPQSLINLGFTRSGFNETERIGFVRKK